MVLAVTLDAFGTLIDAGRAALIHVVRAVLRDAGSGVGAEAFLATWDAHFFAADDEEFLTLAEVTEDSLARAMRDHGIELDAAPYSEMLEQEWLRARPYPEVPRTLARLDGVRRAVVSNADDAFLRGILERNGLAFDAVITSEYARCYKPRPRIFELALDALRVGPGDVVHVGDSLAADVRGASRLGMRTVWVNRAGVRPGPGDPSPDFTIRDLSGLPGIVERLRRGFGAPKTVK